MHPKLTPIHIIKTMNIYLKKSPAALNPLNLHLDTIPKLKNHNNI